MIHVVLGPPCSGKSTYVDEHAAQGEVRIDFDRIATALGSDVPHGSTGGIRRAAFSARQAAIDRCIEDDIPAWVIHSNPTQEQMDAYESVGADFIEMDADLDTCLARAEEDGRPPETLDVIRDWFRDDKEARTMPYRPDTRQYRSFAASNFQPVEREQVFDDDGNDITPDEPTYKVRGYFTTFESEYLLYQAMPSIGMPNEYEQISRHAFDDCDLSDVIAQYDHSGDVLARTRNGSMVVGFDDHGGWCEMRLDGCQRARDMYEAICNGLVVEMSFGFTIADDEDGRGETYFEDENGDYHRTITRVSKLYDTSIVSIPANGDTEVEAIRKRSYLHTIIEKRRAEEAEEQRRAEEAEEQRQAEELRQAEEARQLEEQRARVRLRAKAIRIQSI